MERMKELLQERNSYMRKREWTEGKKWKVEEVLERIRNVRRGGFVSCPVFYSGRYREESDIIGRH